MCRNTGLKMEKYEIFSTTADVGIRIRGSGYGELLQNAVKGLNLLYFEGNKFSFAGTPAVYPFEYHGDSMENVLVNLLSEIVFLVQNENKITVDMKIKEINETYLKADLHIIPAQEEPDLEIKSVTYHNLKIEKKNNILSAAVIFDI
jgi:SHS2 domain-containing protein